jgi:hypothetical protein
VAGKLFAIPSVKSTGAQAENHDPVSMSENGQRFCLGELE